MLTLIDNKKWTILEFFLVNPTIEIHLRALSRKLQISATWISKAVAGFEKSGFIISKKDQESRLIRFRANQDNLNFKRLKISYNFYSLHQSGLLDCLIESYSKPETIVLIGSYRRGEDDEKSDIDIAVITSKNHNGNYSKFEKKLKRKIKILELKKSKVEKEFMNTLANGMVMYGYLDIRR